MQYKGIFYKNKASHKFYEGGAHFSYYSLVKILNEIKENINKDGERDLSSSHNKNNNSNKEKEIDQKQNEIKEKIEIKKLNIPLLSKQKNNSMSYLINDNKKIKNDIIFTKKNDDQLQRTNNSKIKIIDQNIKNSEYSNNIKRINKINKYFNNSIYNNKNSLNMPMINNHKNLGENKTIINGDNKKLLKKKSLDHLKNNKYDYHINMSSTIGFNENNKNYNYLLMNNYNNFLLNKVSRNKNAYNHNIVVQSLNKYNNNYNNSNMGEKFNLINNYNKYKNYAKLNKNIKFHNSNSIDYNINNNYIKLNKNKINNTKINFNKQRRINEKIIINGDKPIEKMNLSIINFGIIKNNGKFYLNKNK